MGCLACRVKIKKVITVATTARGKRNEMERQRTWPLSLPKVSDLFNKKKKMEEEKNTKEIKKGGAERKKERARRLKIASEGKRGTGECSDAASGKSLGGVLTSQVITCNQAIISTPPCAGEKLHSWRCGVVWCALTTTEPAARSVTLIKLKKLLSSPRRLQPTALMDMGLLHASACLSASD